MDPSTPTADFPQVAPACRAPHLSGGGVPGSPRAFSPEFQTLPGSPNGEGPCSSGACSSPASHRGKGQGNMPRLGEGKGRAAPLCPAPRCPGLPPGLPCPSPAPTRSQPPSVLGTTLSVRVSPGCPPTSPTSPTSQGLAATPTLSAFPATWRALPLGSRGRPLLVGAGLRSPACLQRVALSKGHLEPSCGMEATPFPQCIAFTTFLRRYTETSGNLETFQLLYCT